MKKTAEQVTSNAVVVVVTNIMDMISRFLQLKSTTFVQIWQKTPNISRMRKTNNPYAGKVYKFNCLNCVTNYDYEHMINAARSKEAFADFRNDLEPKMQSAGVPQDKIDDFFTIAKSDVTENVADFKAGINSVGNYVGDSKCILENTPKTGEWAGIKGNYIQVCVLIYATPVYYWLENDEALTDAEVIELKSFITPAKPNTKQGLKKEKVIRNPRFETIQAVTLSKVNYQLQ